jgi:hypothetical protein
MVLTYYSEVNNKLCEFYLNGWSERILGNRRVLSFTLSLPLSLNPGLQSRVNLGMPVVSEFSRPCSDSLARVAV